MKTETRPVPLEVPDTIPVWMRVLLGSWYQELISRPDDPIPFTLA